MKKKTKLDDILRVLVQESLDAALKDRAGARYHQQMTKDRELFEEPDLGKFLAEDEDAIPEEDNEIPGSQSEPTSQAPQPASGQPSGSEMGGTSPDRERDQQGSDEESSGDDQDGDKDATAGASFDTVKDAINTLRSGKSLKDEDTKRAALDYYDSLTQEEREAMVVFFRSIGDILRGEAGEKIPPSPDDPPTNLKIQKDDGSGKNNNEPSIETGDNQTGESDGEEMFSLDDIEDIPQDSSQPTPQQAPQASQAQAQMPQMDLGQNQQAQPPAAQPQMQNQTQIMPQNNPTPLPPPPPEAQEDTTPPRRTPIRVNESQDLKDLRNYIRERMKR